MTATDDARPRVAIACQGGGSHTAFTAGVLDRLLSEQDVEFDVVGLSGTSGGALCAFGAWFGLASEPGPGGWEKARQSLAQIWDDLSANGPSDAFANAVGVGLARAQGRGIPLPAFSPYDTVASDWGRRVLRSTLEDAVDPDEFAALLERDEPDVPRLEIGAVDVQRGTFKTFDERTVTYDALLASAAVPNLFQAAPVTQPDGTTRYYWDGLFSQNPPLKSLFTEDDGRLERADELWIVQINPQRENDIPRNLEDILDRRNELGGNLSVNQELRFIRMLNQWEAEGALEAVYRPIEVKVINLDESLASPDGSFDYATKLDRSPAFIERLRNHGREQAAQFLAIERDRRQVRAVLDAAWTTDRAVGLDERFAPAYELHLPTSLSRIRDYVQGESTERSGTLGRAEATALASSVREAFPDLRYSVEETLAEPNKVATRWRATGTHTRALFDIEPTGNEVTLSGMRIDHLTDGRLAESWSLFEQWSLLRQLEATESATPVSTLSRVTPTPVVTQLSAPLENAELVRREIADVWNDGRRDSLDQLLGDDFVLYLDNDTDVRGRDAYFEFVRTYRDAFPDLTVSIEDTVSEGDKIVVRSTVRGTHEGTPILEVEPNGAQIDIARMTIHHIDDGRIVETGIEEDTLRLLQQLGASGASK